MNFTKYCTLITAFLLLSITSYAQETSPPGNPGQPEQPPEMLAMMQCEAEMTKDENMLRDLYHKDIEIYQLPGKLLAKGFDEAINYWKTRFKSEGAFEIEVIQIIESTSDNSAAVKLKRTAEKSQKSTVSIFMIETKNSKIYRLYF